MWTASRNHGPVPDALCGVWVCESTAPDLMPYFGNHLQRVRYALTRLQVVVVGPCDCELKLYRYKR